MHWQHWMNFSIDSLDQMGGAGRRDGVDPPVARRRTVLDKSGVQEEGKQAMTSFPSLVPRPSNRGGKAWYTLCACVLIVTLGLTDDVCVHESDQRAHNKHTTALVACP